MLLVDLRPFDAELTGKEAQEVLDRAGITCNRNTIPDDPRSAFVTSGLRLGTAAETTAGMGPAEMAIIAELIGRTLRHRDDQAVLAGGPGRGGRAVRRLPAVPVATGAAGPAAEPADAPPCRPSAGTPSCWPWRPWSPPR